MSEKHSTDELVDIFYRTDVMCAMTDDELLAIIAKLRAADALCEAIKELLGDGYEIAPVRTIRTIRVRKAIADYEEAK